MHDLLIKRSPKLDRASFIQYAKELGLDVKKFTESIDSQKHARDIDRDLELAVTMDLYTTPTFYIFAGEKWLVSGCSIISGRLLMRS
jgi:predicted DsbA family dithiol-disulfide isomerase